METLPVLGRKRARPIARDATSQLRENVLQLIQSTKAPLLAQRQRVERAYDVAWRSFCRTVQSPPTNNDRVITELTTALKELRDVSNGSRHLLVSKVALSVLISREQARQQRLVVGWIWLGHSYNRLWDMVDVLLAVNRACQEESIVSEWLSSAIQSLIEQSLNAVDQRLFRLVCPAPDASISSSIIQYLVRIAFSEARLKTNVTLSDVDLGDGDRDQSRGEGALAKNTLQAICQVSKDTPRPLAQVCFAVFNSIKHHTNDAAVVTALRVFLRHQVKHFLLHLATLAEPLEADHGVQEIFSTFQLCVSAPDVVQLFRQVWIETNTSRATHDTITSLAPFIASCAQRDSEFRSHALAMAHDLANDAIAASDAALLRQSLELAAAATTGPTDEDGQMEDVGYADWFRNHFAVGMTPLSATTSVSSDHTRQSLSGQSVTLNLSQRCLRAPIPPPSSAGSASSDHGHSACGLVSTKRHLQFVCAFLLEFDRVDSPRQRAHHVFAHLSAMKTHQTISGSAVGGLLSDFCAQTRSRFGQLESQESQVMARLRRRRLSSMSSIKTTPSGIAAPSQSTHFASQYPSNVRGDVEELLELHARDQNALVAKVNQRKLFEAHYWKQELLPCCLDLEYWQDSVFIPQFAPEDEIQHLLQERHKRTSDVVSLVQILAKHHAVGTQEYVAFLERVEAWFVSIKHAVGTPTRRITHRTNELNLTALTQAVDAFIEVYDQFPKYHKLQEHSSWKSVIRCFITAFEGLIGELPTEKHEQMQTIHMSIAERLAKEVATKKFSFDHAVEHYMSLWIALLSNETSDIIAPDERMHLMNAYCKLASQRAIRETSSENEKLAESSLLGSLLGVLASVPVCEALARSASLSFCLQLVPTTTDPSLDDLVRHLKRASAFLSGFCTGFVQTPHENTPQVLLQSMLTPPIRDCLIWVGHHTSIWWDITFVSSATEDPDPFWSFVRRSLQSVHDQYGWFRLTFSPGVFTSKDQWQVFVAMELACCVTELFGENRCRLDLIDFISLQHEQMHTLMLSSAGGKTAGVRGIDVCIWIVQTILEVSASSPLVTRVALDALVFLLKDIWRTHELSASGETASPSDVLGFLMEMSLQLIERSPHHQVQVIQYAIRCARVMVEGKAQTPPLVNVAPLVIRHFIDQVASSSETMTVPFEWVSVVWCIVAKLQHANVIYTNVTELPASLFAHWSYEFPRLCRLLIVRKNGKVSHATNATFLRSIQTCYEFFRTLNVRRLALAPAVSLLGASASQYVPTSTADETLTLHVRALEWLVASELVEVPRVGLEAALVLEFTTSLAFHQTATRVLVAILEDVSIGRPEDVANELTEVCQTAWVASVSSKGDRSDHARLQYQLLLIYMVTDLAARHASVGRFLLRSSSELLQDSRRALFLLQVLIASKEIEQIDHLLKLNGSLWVNTFAEVACSLADLQTSGTETDVFPVSSILQQSSGFNDQLTGVVSRLLRFAAARQIDLLDSTVSVRLETLFPTLQPLLANVPVLTVPSAALGEW